MNCDGSAFEFDGEEEEDKYDTMDGPSEEDAYLQGGFDDQGVALLLTSRFYRRIQDDPPTRRRSIAWKGSEANDGPSYRPNAGRAELEESNI
jgi:hypothetical protein